MRGHGTGGGGGDGGGCGGCGGGGRPLIERSVAGLVPLQKGEPLGQRVQHLGHGRAQVAGLCSAVVVGQDEAADGEGRDACLCFS